MRPTKLEWAMDVAKVTAERATCLRRKVGCVLLDVSGNVISTGYNGVARGLPHCNESRLRPSTGGVKTAYMSTHPNACSGADSASGQNLDGCQAIHAEQNALLQAGNVLYVHQCIVTTSPCMTCMKLLLNTQCKEIVFFEEYPNSGEVKKIWVGAGRLWLDFKTLQ